MNNSRTSETICTDSHDIPAHLPLVSVIIPVFNAERYLSKALASVLGQREFDDMEIICVNDGSTDNSRTILAAFSSKDHRIRIIDQENRGPSAARNAGTRAASGKYLYYMDADDLLEPEAMALLSAEMEKDNLDFLCFNANAFAEDPASQAKADHYDKISKRELKEGVVGSGQSLFRESRTNPDLAHIIMPAWSCIVSRCFIIENQIRFSEDPRIQMEDEIWSFTVLMKAQRAACLNKCLYRYRIHRNSRQRGIDRYKLILHYFLCVLEMQKVLGAPDFVCEPGMNTFLIELVRNYQMAAIRNYRTCKREVKEKFSHLQLEDAIKFDCLVVYPSMLADEAKGLSD